MTKNPSETNHDYFCRLAGKKCSGYEMAHMLNTTVEDVMCAQGDWFVTLADRAMAYSTNGAQMTNTYATDGKCHNSEPGTFNHECGQPAKWVGLKANGFESGFCDHCKQYGYEARACQSWRPFGKPVN